MTFFPIKTNTAANDMPISVVSEQDFEDKDLEAIQCEMAAVQQKIADDVKAWMDVAKAQNKKKHLDWEKKEADDKAKKLKEAEEAQKAEEVRKVEVRKMAQAVSTRKI